MAAAPASSLRAAAILVAGGSSRRMGRDKLFLEAGGEALLTRVARALAPRFQPLVVVRAPARAVPPLPEGTILVEDARPGEGPLEGLRVGLAALGRDVGAAFVAAADLPFLSAAFAQAMVSRLLASDADAAVVHDGGRRHPLAAAYRPRVLAAVEELVRRGERSLLALLDVSAVLPVAPGELAHVDPTLDALVNVNVPAEWERARARLAREALERGA